MDNKVLYKLSYGVYAIGAMDGARPSGCIVNTVFQITSSGMLALSMNFDNYTHSLLNKTGRFSISILTEAVEPSIIGALGFSSGKDKNKFDNVPYEMKAGLPVIKEGSAGFIICEVKGHYDTDTHTVYFAQAVDAEALSSDAPPMTYDYYHRVVKGKAPKNAPTYRAEEAQPEPKPETNLQYECSVCGYVYEGDITKEPDDYVCPVCGAPKSEFFKK